MNSLKSLAQLVQEAREGLEVVNACDAIVALQLNKGLLIDVRESQEHAKGAIENAINIPRGILEPQMLSNHQDASRDIFLHCASGARASFAAQQLKKLGYQKVYVIGDNYSEIEKAFSPNG